MATRSLNKVMLIGNLTRDPELRYTPQGTAVCNFGVATNRYWVTESGEKKEDTEFHRVVAWNKLAELCSQLLAKGRKVYVEGRLQTRTWTGADGNQRTTTEIVISDMVILDSKRAFEARRAAGTGGEEIDVSAEEALVEKVEEEATSEEKTEEASEEKKDKGVGGGKGASASDKKKKADQGKKQSSQASQDEEKEKGQDGEEKVSPDEIPF